MRNILLKGFVLGILLVTSARAATNIINFNSDPSSTGLYKEPPGGSSAAWRPSGGASGAPNDGYLAINDASGGAYGVLAFKDLEAGLIVKAFSFECDLRVGGGRNRPADGFSLNYVSSNDPINDDIEKWHCQLFL